MGENESARVDATALLAVARRYDDVADLVEDVLRTQLRRLSFDGAIAGADHAADGDALRRAVEDVVGRLSIWARALREIATALTVSAHRYAVVDARVALRLG